MEQMILLPLLGDRPGMQVNFSAGKKGTEVSTLAFLQLIEALLNLELNPSGKVDDKGERGLLNLAVSGEKHHGEEKHHVEEKEQLNSSSQGILQLSAGGKLDSLNYIEADAQPDYGSSVIGGMLHQFSSLAKGMDSSDCSVTTQQALWCMEESGLIKTFVNGKMYLKNNHQGVLAGVLKENILTHILQDSPQQKDSTQRFSVFTDSAVKTETVPLIAAELESSMAQQTDTSAVKKSAEAGQGTLFEPFSGAQKGEMYVNVTEDSIGINYEAAGKNEQLDYLSTKLYSSPTEEVVLHQKNKVSIIKDILPGETVEFITKHIVDKAKLFVGKERADLKLQLDPNFLGHLKLIIRVEKGIVHTHFIAENQITASLIEGQVQELRHCLEQQGITWQEISVSVEGQDSFQNYNGSGAYRNSQEQEFIRGDFTHDEQTEQGTCPGWHQGSVDYLV